MSCYLHSSLVFGRSFIKRSFSDGNILGENSEPVSTNNGGGTENVILGLPVNLQSEEITEHSDSAPDISATETELSYSRFVFVFSITFHVKLFLMLSVPRLSLQCWLATD